MRNTESYQRVIHATNFIKLSKENKNLATSLHSIN
jgi:hypothetical protein